MSRVPRLLLGLLAFSALLSQLPASLWSGVLRQACAGQCRLSDTSGLWWAGQGQLHIRATPKGPWLNLGRVQWQPGASGQGLSLHIQLNEGRLELRVGASGMVLAASHWSLPADVLAWPALKLSSAGWQGQIELENAQGTLDWQGQSQGQGQLVWRDASSSLVNNLPLGHVHSQWRFQQGWYVDFESGRPEWGHLQGHATWPLQGAKQLISEFQLQGPDRPRVEKLLSVVGARAVPGENRYQLQLAW